MQPTAKRSRFATSRLHLTLPRPKVATTVSKSIALTQQHKYYCLLPFATLSISSDITTTEERDTHPTAFRQETEISGLRSVRGLYQQDTIYCHCCAPELFKYPWEEVLKRMTTHPACKRDTNDIQTMASPDHKQPRAIIRHGNLFTCLLYTSDAADE